MGKPLFTGPEAVCVPTVGRMPDGSPIEGEPYGSVEGARVDEEADEEERVHVPFVFAGGEWFKRAAQSNAKEVVAYLAETDGRGQLTWPRLKLSRPSFGL